MEPGAGESFRPVRPNGPWVVLCDNESFLSSTKCGLPTVYRRAKIRLWHVPPKSPDLNPVEKYWVVVEETVAPHGFGRAEGGAASA